MQELTFTDAELQALRKEYAANVSDSGFILWIEECKRRRLVPGRDIVLQIRSVKEYDEEQKKKVFKQKAVYITTIAALRKIAERTQQFGGQLPSQWVYLDDSGAPTIVSDVPLPKKDKPKEIREPWAAKATIRRKDWQEPVTVPARWGAYAQFFRTEEGTFLTSTWATRGPEQLEKCAEALALRKAFPEELGGLYIAEEMKDDQDTDYTITEAPAAETSAKKPKKSKSSGSVSGATQESTTPPVAQESTSAAVPPAVPASPGGNIHGVNITDDDLPDNLQPKKPAIEITKELVQEKTRAYAKAAGTDLVKTFIMKRAGVDDTRKIPKEKWADIVQEMDAALAKGADALKELVK